MPDDTWLYNVTTYGLWMNLDSKWPSRFLPQTVEFWCNIFVVIYTTNMRITDDFTHPSGPWHKNTSLVQIKICGRSYGTKIRWSLQSPSYEFVPVDLGWQMSVISPPKFFREHHRVKKKSICMILCVLIKKTHSWWMFNDPSNAHSPYRHSSCIETSRISTLRVPLNYNTNCKWVIENKNKHSI